MNYTIKPIETYHNGTWYRSRLEATVAAFFDMCKWPYEYEPEVDTTGWIPDFILKTPYPCLVEVKPEFEQRDLHKILRATQKRRETILTIDGKWEKGAMGRLYNIELSFHIAYEYGYAGIDAYLIDGPKERHGFGRYFDLAGVDATDTMDYGLLGITDTFVCTSFEGAGANLRGQGQEGLYMIDQEDTAMMWAEAKRVVRYEPKKGAM